MEFYNPNFTGFQGLHSYPPPLPDVSIVARLDRLETLVRQLLARPALDSNTIATLASLCEALQAPPPTLSDSGYSSDTRSRTRRPTPRRNKREKSSPDLWSEPTPGNWTGSSVEYHAGREAVVVPKQERKVTFSPSATNFGNNRPRSQKGRNAVAPKSAYTSDSESEWKVVRSRKRPNRIPVASEDFSEDAGSSRPKRKQSRKSRKNRPRQRATPSVTPAMVDNEAASRVPKSSRTESTTDDKRVACTECKKLGFWSFGVCGDCQVSSHSLSVPTPFSAVPFSASKIVPGKTGGITIEVTKRIPPGHGDTVQSVTLPDSLPKAASPTWSEPDLAPLRDQVPDFRKGKL